MARKNMGRSLNDRLTRATKRLELEIDIIDVRALALEVNKRMIAKGFITGRIVGATPDGVQVLGRARFSGNWDAEARKIAHQVLEEKF